MTKEKESYVSFELRKCVEGENGGGECVAHRQKVYIKVANENCKTEGTGRMKKVTATSFVFTAFFFIIPKLPLLSVSHSQNLNRNKVEFY